jgi:hypothetical protein
VERRVRHRAAQVGRGQRRSGHRPEAIVKRRAYNQTVDEWTNPNEDDRGVDVGQIRELLRMSVAERAHEMVRVANLMAKARETALRGQNSAP